MNQIHLNDDCLRLILEKLDVEHQMAAARAHHRFYEVLTEIWQRKIERFDCLYLYILSFEDRALLLRSICSTVREMELKGLTYEEFTIIKQLSFPNVRELDLWNPKPCWDEAILEMTELFPNVESFSATHTNMSGRNMEKWQFLQHLDVFTCEGFQFKSFETILETCQLKSIRLGLEAFKTGETWTSAEAIRKFSELENISFVVVETPFMSNFEILFTVEVIQIIGGVSGKEEFFLKMVSYLCKYKRNDLIEFEVESDKPFDEFFLNTFKNLRKFSVHCKWRNTIDFTKILKVAPNVNEVAIINCQEPLKKSIILDWLYCEQISFISIELCVCEFPKLELDVKEIFARRKTPLVLNFHKNSINMGLHFYKNSLNMGFFHVPVSLVVHGEDPLLKVTSRRKAHWLSTYRWKFRKL